VQLDIAFNGWPESQELAELPELAASAVGSTVEELANARLHTSVLFTSDEQIHALNKEWRGRDKPTNVLSFPMLAREELLDLQPEGPPVMLGDIALAHATCKREAKDKSITIHDHAAHLIVHGLLHLAGYDHETSDADAEKMEALEVQILAKLGIANPYRAA
jgi:probable rRNA maturation factor